MKSEEQGRVKKSNTDLSNTKDGTRIRGKYYTLLEISSEDIEGWELGTEKDKPNLMTSHLLFSDAGTDTFFSVA